MEDLSTKDLVKKISDSLFEKGIMFSDSVKVVTKITMEYVK